MTLTDAVAEAREFLGAHHEFSGDREVRCVTPFSAEKPSMTLGALRALFSLAEDLTALAEASTPAEIDRALAR